MSTVKNVLKVDDTEILGREAEIFGSYLIHDAPRRDVVDLYIKALTHKPGVQTPQDRRRLDFVRRHPQLLRFVDPGLAVVNPSSEVRRRIYIMFSILEAVPYYHDYFLPKSRKWWYFFVVGLKGVWGLVKTAIGAVLVRAVV